MSIYEDLPSAAVPVVHIHQAVISRGASDMNDPVFVMIPGFSEKYVWGPCYWMPRYYYQPTDVSEGADSPTGDTEESHIIEKFMYPLFPQRDDKALVCYDNDRQLWVIAWWPLNMQGDGTRG